jgi:glutathione S-transferase
MDDGKGAGTALTLYTSWFSTFARKVALGLDLKGLAYEAIDALERDFRPQLMALNPRAEVPVLTDGTLTIVNSSDILRYLEERFPEPRLFPAKIEDRVLARALERLADQRLDPIVVDCSFWGWAERPDEPPPGLREAGQADLESVLETLEDALGGRPRPWPFEAPGVVECAWFPNLVAARPLGFRLDEARFPRVAGWLAAMRDHPLFAQDRQRTAAFLRALSSSNHERSRLFWSGDRLEWLLSRGFHGWFLGEIRAGRATFPPYASAG